MVTADILARFVDQMRNLTILIKRLPECHKLLLFVDCGLQICIDLQILLQICRQEDKEREGMNVFSKATWNTAVLNFSHQTDHDHT